MPSLTMFLLFVNIAAVACLPHQKGNLGNKGSVCQNYMEDCNPFYDTCCEDLGLTCVNLRKGFCAYPHERCVCQKKSSANIDQWLMY